MQEEKIRQMLRTNIRQMCRIKSVQFPGEQRHVVGEVEVGAAEYQGVTQHRSRSALLLLAITHQVNKTGIYRLSCYK